MSGASPRNVIILHAHDMGRFTAPYQPTAATPHLAEFAASGVTFLNAHCCGPTCSPSRAALLTGEYPHQAGMFGLSHLGWTLKHPERHMGRYFSSVGLQTVRVGLQHEYDGATESMYDEEWPVRTGDPLRRDEDALEQAIDWIRKAGHTRPFFLWFGMFQPHLPWRSGTMGNHSHGFSIPANLPDCEGVRADLADFSESLNATDRVMGNFLAALEETGLGDQTAVIVTTDHGIPLPRHKCNLTMHGTGVTFISRFPGLTRAGSRSPAMVSHLDLYPTLCDWLRCPHPPWLQGASLLPHLAGQQTHVHRRLFAEINYHIDLQPERSVRSEDWLYVRRFNADSRISLPNCDDTRSKSHLIDNAWGESVRAEELLFDLKQDSNEQNSMAESPSARLNLDELRGELFEWMRSTNDPLLDDPCGIFDIPSPQSAASK